MNNIPETMRALVAHAPGDYRLETVPTPRAAGDDLIVRVEGCGVCAGDLKAFNGAPSFWGGEGNPPYIKSPMIPGHEFVGRVVEVGTVAEVFAQPRNEVTRELIGEVIIHE